MCEAGAQKLVLEPRSGGSREGKTNRRRQHDGHQKVSLMEVAALFQFGRSIQTTMKLFLLCALYICITPAHLTQSMITPKVGVFAAIIVIIYSGENIENEPFFLAYRKSHFRVSLTRTLRRHDMTHVLSNGVGMLDSTGFQTNKGARQFLHREVGRGGTSHDLIHLQIVVLHRVPIFQCELMA